MIAEIVAVAHNNVIGRDNDFPWYLSDDLRRFKSLTTGHKIIMGRNSYDHLLVRTKGKLLPDRTSIVLTRSADFEALPGTLVAHSIEEALSYVAPDEDAFIIGGAQIYRQALPFVDRIYLTEIEADIDGDAFFPVLDMSQWQVVSREQHARDERNDYDYSFAILDRI